MPGDGASIGTEAEQQAKDDALAKALGLWLTAEEAAAEEHSLGRAEKKAREAAADFVFRQGQYRPARVAFFAAQEEFNKLPDDSKGMPLEYLTKTDHAIVLRYQNAKHDFDEAKAALEMAEEHGLVGKARTGDVVGVEALLKKDGVDLNTRDSTGQRALTAALNSMGKMLRSREKMVEFLLAQEGIDVNSPDAICPPLHHAVHGNCLYEVRLLIKHKGISLDQKNADDKSAMQVAQTTQPSERYADIVTDLKAAGATEFPNPSGCCVLS